jgi:hypothetical protein
MGLLVVGTPLAWDESKKYIPKVKQDGVTQFLALYDRLKGRPEEPLLWGDEVSPARSRQTNSLAALGSCSQLPLAVTAVCTPWSGGLSYILIISLPTSASV